MKQIVVVLVLVLLPTGVLSIMAHLSLTKREQMLRERFRLAAESSIQSVSRRLESALHGDANQIRATFNEYLQRTAKFQDIESTANRLRETLSFVDGVFLFMDPWELIYPGGKLRPDRGEIYKAHKSMIAELRKVVSVRTGTDPFLFRKDGNVYCFVLLAGRKDLYAGYKIDSTTFTSHLQNSINIESGEGFRIDIRKHRTEPVSRSVEEIHRDWHESVLVRKPLFEPYDNIVLTGALQDDVLAARGSQWRTQLYGWGIVLLAAFICAGMVIALVQGAEEVRKARARSEFLVGVSHDLRTPVASMKMLSESLLDGRVKDPEKERRFLSTITGECEKLGQLIERVIYFVRLGQNALVYNRQSLDAGRIIRQSVEAFKARFRENPPDLELRIPRSLPPVSADENAISQALLNLLDNASKYGSGTSRAEPVRIVITAACEDRRKNILSPKTIWVRISVRDFGPGMSPAQRKKVFRRYYRIPGAEASNISGVGLGLSLCSHIIRAHDGWMEVHSESGKGSAFCFFLPTVGGGGTTDEGEKAERDLKLRKAQKDLSACDAQAGAKMGKGMWDVGRRTWEGGGISNDEHGMSNDEGRREELTTKCAKGREKGRGM